MMSIILITCLEMHTKSQISKQGIYARINFDYPLSTKCFYLCTGIEYEDKGFKTKVMSQTDSGTYATGGSYSYIVYHQELYHYRYINLPIGLKYFIVNRKIKISVLAGIDICLWGKLYTNSTSTGIYYTPAPTGVPRTIGGAVKVGLGYQISPHFLVSFDPGYSMSFLNNPPLGGTTNAYKARLYSFVFPLTLSYVFTK
jgi:hypothetical protein